MLHGIHGLGCEIEKGSRFTFFPISPCPVFKTDRPFHVFNLAERRAEVIRQIPAKPAIWIIDSQQWPRAYLRAELIKRGFEVIGFVELGEAMAAPCDSEYVKPRLIVLELQGQSIAETDLKVLARFGIPAVALGGATELSDEMIKSFKWAALMQRPFSIGEVADVVEEWVSR